MGELWFQMQLSDGYQMKKLKPNMFFHLYPKGINFEYLFPYTP